MEIFKLIEKWGEDRGFYTPEGATLEGQLVKLVEETGELAGNIAKGRDIKDDIGDIAVVLTHIARLAGTDIETCLYVAYKDIEHRKGKFVAGKFIKESDVQTYETHCGDKYFV